MKENSFRLAIVIVSYNSGHVLRFSLPVLQNLPKDVKIIVVDNASRDDSVAVAEKYGAEVIQLPRNVGFGRACNVGWKSVVSEYVLFLNPDVLIDKAVIEESLLFMDSNEDIGLMGIRLVDGKGNYLKESQRKIPDVASAFKKLFLPWTSKHSGYYYEDEQLRDVEALAGAFMLARRQALEEVNGFDEDYFMYGEDIDLSLRVKQKGWRVVYNPHIEAIHFKGASTERLNWKPIFWFHQAMYLFVKKHKNYDFVTRLLVFVGIWLRAISVFMIRQVKRLIFPIIDFFIVLLVFWIVQFVWGFYVKGFEYPSTFRFVILPVFSALVVLSMYVGGGYREPVQWGRVFRASLLAQISVLLLYALLPEEWRFSRAVILIGSALGIISILFFRLFSVNIRLLRQNPISSGFYYVFKGTGHDVLAHLFSLHSVKASPSCNASSEYAYPVLIQSVPQPMSRLLGNIKSGTFITTMFLNPEEKILISGEQVHSTNRWIALFHPLPLNQWHRRVLKRLADLLWGTLFFVVPKGRVSRRLAWKLVVGKRTLTGYKVRSVWLPTLPEPIVDVGVQCDDPFEQACYFCHIWDLAFDLQVVGRVLKLDRQVGK
ncbi:MAG: glycosyltransferase [Chlorobi bacterium]|nr:glycosyltransferase [Chlorobiota bacterium]